MKTWDEMKLINNENTNNLMCVGGDNIHKWI
jgi:hypothetical protein